MPRVQLTPTAKAALFFLRIYLIALLGLLAGQVPQNLLTGPRPRGFGKLAQRAEGERWVGGPAARVGGTMARTRKSNLAVGVILVVVGGVLLVTRFVPMDTAPAWLLGLGVGLALIAIVSVSYGALVAGMVLLGLGAGMVLGDRGVAGIRVRHLDPPRPGRRLHRDLRAGAHPQAAQPLVAAGPGRHPARARRRALPPALRAGAARGGDGRAHLVARCARAWSACGCSSAPSAPRSRQQAKGNRYEELGRREAQRLRRSTLLPL